jgi:hypothetical protein
VCVRGVATSCAKYILKIPGAPSCWRHHSSCTLFLCSDLNNAGLAIRAAGEVGLTTRQLDLLYNPIPGVCVCVHDSCARTSGHHQLGQGMPRTTDALP